jgi:acyl-CoA thioesterase-2
MSNWNSPLSEVLRIEAQGESAYRALLPGFGGVTLGCATLAAARSCADKHLHSLHTYFFRPVPTDRPVDLVVERVRDGRRFSHRRVQVCSEGKLSCELVASFAAPGGGPEYQEAELDAGLPQPEDLPTEAEIAEREGWNLDEPGPLSGALEWRWIGGTPWDPATTRAASAYNAWVRPRYALPADRALHTAAIALLSDYHSHMSVGRKLGGPFEPFNYTSLDQVLWLHRDPMWDDWYLIHTASHIAHAGRALTRRLVYARNGRLIASMEQEQIIPGSSL